MATAVCSDIEFVRLWKETGGSPARMAERLGISVRNIYARRNRLEKFHTLDLTSGEAITYNYPKRVNIDGFTGTAVIFSDCHWWPGLSINTAFKALIEVIKEIKPKLVIANGDILDGARISRFPRDGWSSQPRMSDELQEVKDRMADVRHAYRGARHIRTIGNHCVRFDRYLAVNASELEGIEGARLSDHLREWQECMSVFINGNTMVKHRIANGMHAGYNNTLRSGTNTITGHTHRLLIRPWGDYNGRRYGVEGGCLADVGGPQFLYAEDNPTDACPGFVVATFEKEGNMRCPELCEVMNGTAYFRGHVVAGGKK